MPKFASKSKKRAITDLGKIEEDDEMDRPLKTEKYDLNPSADKDHDKEDEDEDMANIGSLGFQNPFASIYSQAVQMNAVEKESALRNFKIDAIKDEIKQTAEQLDYNSKIKSRKAGGAPLVRSSPYAIRERKKKINYGEIDLKTSSAQPVTTVPLRRYSLRLVNEPPSFDVSSVVEEESLESAKRIKRGPVKMDEVVMETVDEEKWAEDMKRLGKYLAEGKREETEAMGKFWKMEIDRFKTAKRFWSYPAKDPDKLDTFKAKVSKLRIWCGTVGRVLTERVTSMAIHPSRDCLLISAGGKRGTLGIWVEFPRNSGGSEDKRETALDYPTGINRFRPHNGLINCASFCRFSGDRLITTSYDGTVRLLNLEKLVFDQLYGSPEDMRNYWMQWHCQLSPNTLLASQGTGNVYVLDDRSKKEYEAVLRCYERSCRTVDIHPLYPQYLATSSSCGYTSIWDLRKFRVRGGSANKIPGILDNDGAVCHLGNENRKLFSAFFSPVTGNGLLTTSSDDYIRLYDTSSLTQTAKATKYRVETSIRHNNRTGRWLTTFKAAWHPQRDDAFVVGCMGQPREVEVYGKHGCLLASIGKDGPLPLNTICSVNVFHPNRLVLASADSAGRVHVFL